MGIGGGSVAQLEELFSVQGKVVVVTGGSRAYNTMSFGQESRAGMCPPASRSSVPSAGGMGKEMSKAFALGGAHVVIASRKMESCELLAKEIERNPDCTGRAVPVAFNE